MHIFLLTATGSNVEKKLSLSKNLDLINLADLNFEILP